MCRVHRTNEIGVRVFICVVLADAQEIMDEFVQESKYHKTSRIFINLKSSRNVKRNILIGVDKKRKKWKVNISNKKVTMEINVVMLVDLFVKLSKLFDFFYKINYVI